MNWKNLISSLEANGKTREEIAQETGCSLSLINALARGARGKRLSWDIGDKLIALHGRVCPVEGG